MPKENAVQKGIKQAKFLKALVDSGGVAKDAYQAVRPRVNDNSAKSMGSKELAKISQTDVNALYEKIGCTKEAVLNGLWDRMKAGTTAYGEGTRILSKIAGWESNSGGLRELLDRDLDLIEVVKIRLRKSNDKKNIQQPIDVQCTPSDNLDSSDSSDRTATSKA